MFFPYLHICWLLVVLIYNFVDVGHIHGEDDNSRQVWVPKMCVQRIKSQNFKIGSVPLIVLLVFIVIVIKQLNYTEISPFTQCAVIQLFETSFCPHYEREFVDASDITAMLNMHFDWIIILQGFLNVVLKTCCIFGNHILSWVNLGNLTAISHLLFLEKLMIGVFNVTIFCLND